MDEVPENGTKSLNSAHANGMDEVPENGMKSLNSAHANGMNECTFTQMICLFM
jgi:hypothetical protein